MKITSQIQNSHNHHHITLSTNDATHTITIPPKTTGYGSSANGGELLFLALATCYCNDIYREAAARGIEVTAVEVAVTGDFGGPGDPARNVVYHTRISGKASAADLQALARHTDTVAEIQNTLRLGMAVTLERVEVVPI